MNKDKSVFEDKTKLWVIHIGNDDEIAERAQSEGFVCIGWTKMGDLSAYHSRDKMKAAYRRTWPNASDASVRSSYGQPYRFAHEMKVGDPIVYPIKGSREILIGEIAGPYRWAADDKGLLEADYCNVRDVRWLTRVPRIEFSQDALHSFGGYSSVATSDDYLEEVINVLEGQPNVPELEETDQSQTERTQPIDDEMARINVSERASEETEDYLLRQWSRSEQKFEHVVAAVFRAMGYTAHVTRGTRDLGVDVIAHPDPLGVQPPFLKIQAKSGTNTAGSNEVKALRGLLNPNETGVFVALGGFTHDAKHVEQNTGNMVFVDGQRFVELFLEFYDRLDAETRSKFPLRSTYVVVG